MLLSRDTICADGGDPTDDKHQIDGIFDGIFCSISLLIGSCRFCGAQQFDPGSGHQYSCGCQGKQRRRFAIFADTN